MNDSVAKCIITVEILSLLLIHEKTFQLPSDYV